MTILFMAILFMVTLSMVILFMVTLFMVILFMVILFMVTLIMLLLFMVILFIKLSNRYEYIFHAFVKAFTNAGTPSKSPPFVRPLIFVSVSHNLLYCYKNLQ